MYVRYVPLRCFGQHTNSTPENSDIPQGNNIAKLLRFIFLSLQVSAAVAFHLKRKIPGLCSQFLFLSANYEFAFQTIQLYIPVCKILFAFFYLSSIYISIYISILYFYLSSSRFPSDTFFALSLDRGYR